ncbi:MAG TPA: urease accessory protein UreE [Polyangiaceae bacterium]
MIVYRELCTDPVAHAEASLSLSFHKRRSSRQRARLSSGEEIALILPRGTVLSDGSVLRGEGGQLLRVEAAPERVSRIVSEDSLLLTRAAYHLGNRHIAVQVEPGNLSYLHDHVLDDLVRGLGLSVEVMDAPFEPESGAYGAHGHGGHDHDDHEHSHHHHEHHAPHVHERHEPEPDTRRHLPLHRREDAKGTTDPELPP